MALPAEMAPEVDASRSGHGALLAFPGSSGRVDSAEADVQAAYVMRQPGGLYCRLKYPLDVIAASVLFVCALPVLLLIAAAVALTSPGGVFFRQTRVGMDMQPFQCLKFRTMVPDAESILLRDPELARIHALNWKIDNDPRVTRIGKFLRKTSLDELPQLVNVINGEMSLIGPRPYMPSELADEFGYHAAAITSVRPGMTGLWQVSGRAHLTPIERIMLDREYASTAAFVLDAQIAVRTITVVTIGRGAF
jgi:lipopolysaccharide/colanic/teichoic acid biosynthesis glycosyltransferase